MGKIISKESLVFAFLVFMIGIMIVKAIGDNRTIQDNPDKDMTEIVKMRTMDNVLIMMSLIVGMNIGYTASKECEDLIIIGRMKEVKEDDRKDK